jgi:kinesin family protein C2/C3
VESPVDSGLIPDGAPLSAFQYFENVRNFLVAVQEIGIPTFEASDLEQVCKGSNFYYIFKKIKLSDKCIMVN